MSLLNQSVNEEQRRPAVDRPAGGANAFLNRALRSCPHPRSAGVKVEIDSAGRGPGKPKQFYLDTARTVGRNAFLAVLFATGGVASSVRDRMGILPLARLAIG